MKLDLKTIQNINLFEKITGANVRDCVEHNGLVFIVEEGHIQRAVSGVHRIEGLLKQKVSVIGFSSDVVKFIRNLIYPVKAKISLDNEVVVISVDDARLKGRIFGRDKSNLKWINSLVGKYFSGVSVRVE